MPYDLDERGLYRVGFWETRFGNFLADVLASALFGGGAFGVLYFIAAVCFWGRPPDLALAVVRLLGAAMFVVAILVLQSSAAEDRRLRARRKELDQRRLAERGHL